MAYTGRFIADTFNIQGAASAPSGSGAGTPPPANVLTKQQQKEVACNAAALAIQKFVWADTEEGQTFWHDVYVRLSKKAQGAR